jgi:hypothetical protein
MARNRREREIHRALIHGDVGLFHQWKCGGKNLSYFHKNMIAYDYKIRNYVFMSTGRSENVFPIKVKHCGWPTRSPMTPQAWTVMELLAGFQYMEDINYPLPEDIYDAILFISTCILQSEIKCLWEELLNTVYICTEQKADIWVCILHAMITGTMNGRAECEIHTPSEECVVSKTIEFFTRKRKIELMRELYYNRRDSFDRYIRWIFNDDRTPLILRRLFSLEQTSLEHIHSLMLSPPSSSLQYTSFSYRPQSPLEQTGTLDSTFSPSSPSEESE